MSREIIQEMGTCSLSAFRWSRLFVRYFIECGEDCRVNSPCIIQEYACNSLNSFGTFGIQRFGKIFCCKLDFLAIDGTSPRMWGMLWLERRFVVEFVQCFVDI